MTADCVDGIVDRARIVATLRSSGNARVGRSTRGAIVPS